MKKLLAIFVIIITSALLVGPVIGARDSFCARNPTHWKCVSPTPVPTPTPLITPTPTPLITPTPATPTPVITPTPTPVITPTPTPTPPNACTRTATAPTNGSDATSGLNADIAATPNGGTLCLVAGATYRISGTWLVEQRNGLTIDGRGAIVRRDVERATTMLQLQIGQDLTIRNLIIDGASTQSGVWRYALEAGHGIRFGGAIRTLIEGVTIRNVTGDAVYLAGGRLPPDWTVIRAADDITIRNSIIDGTGRNGISITDGGNNVQIDHNLIRDIGYYTFDIEPNGHGLGGVGVDFVDNTVGPNGYAYNPTVHGFIFAVTGSSGGGPAIDVTVARNTLLGQPFRVGVYNNGGARQGIVVSDNVSDTVNDGQVMLPLLFFGGVSGLQVTNNRGFNNSEVSVSGGSNVTVAGNSR